MLDHLGLLSTNILLYIVVNTCHISYNWTSKHTYFSKCNVSVKSISCESYDSTDSVSVKRAIIGLVIVPH